MEYERIDKKPSHLKAGGFSPTKLRAMLLGGEKRREEAEDDFDSRLRSADPDDARGGSGSDGCRDVSECSTSTDADSGGGGGGGRKHVAGAAPRVRSQDEEQFDSESVTSSVFEFHKSERAVHRQGVVPLFSKPTPSKWDDAEKWIASPTSNRGGRAGAQGQGKKAGLIGYGGRHPAPKVVLEVVDEMDGMRVDPVKREIGGHKAASWVPEQFRATDSGAKTALNLENKAEAVSISRQDSSQSVHSTTTFTTPPSSVKSVSMRDMGTEMTPIASQEPSQTGTPVGATTPTRSATSSRPSTPPRSTRSSVMVESEDFHEDSSKKGLSEEELQKEVRREIMVLGTKLGKTNITAWARKEQEGTDTSTSPKTVPFDEPIINVIENRASAWEEAEKAKYLASFKQEEVNIQAWENHQKAKIEAEMRKIEVEVERMKACAHDRLMNQLAAASHKAEEKRAAAEAKRNQQAAKTAQQAEYIRKTGRIPSSFSCWGLCS